MKKETSENRVVLVDKSENLDMRYSSFSKEELIKYLDEKSAKVPEEYRNTIKFEIKDYSEYDADYYDMFMHYKIPENEDEKKARLIKEDEMKALVEKQKKYKADWEAFQEWKKNNP